MAETGSDQDASQDASGARAWGAGRRDTPAERRARLVRAHQLFPEDTDRLRGQRVRAFLYICGEPGCPEFQLVYSAGFPTGAEATDQVLPERTDWRRVRGVWYCGRHAAGRAATPESEEQA